MGWIFMYFWSLNVKYGGEIWYSQVYEKQKNPPALENIFGLLRLNYTEQNGLFSEAGEVLCKIHVQKGSSKKII